MWFIIVLCAHWTDNLEWIKCNWFLLGLRIAYRYFPEGLMTGTPNQNITETTKPPKTKEKASQKSFTTFDLEKLHTQLDSQLSDRSVGSKCPVLSLESHRISGGSASSGLRDVVTLIRSWGWGEGIIQCNVTANVLYFIESVLVFIEMEFKNRNFTPRFDYLCYDDF